MSKGNLENSLLGTEGAEILKENNPKAFRRYKKLEKGPFFYRVAKSFLNGLCLVMPENFTDPNYDVLRDLYT